LRKNIAENINPLSRAHERYRQTTDDRRQTTDDRRQTDGRTTTYSEHELEFTFAKNWFLCIICSYFILLKHALTYYYCTLHIL